MFDIPHDYNKWRTRVSAKASNLYNSVVDSRLRSVLLRARDTQLAEEEYIESVGAGITTKHQTDGARLMKIILLDRCLNWCLRCALESTLSLNSI